MKIQKATWFDWVLFYLIYACFAVSLPFAYVVNAVRRYFNG